jgi:hypothetical protein
MNSSKNNETKEVLQPLAAIFDALKQIFDCLELLKSTPDVEVRKFVINALNQALAAASLVILRVQKRVEEIRNLLLIDEIAAKNMAAKWFGDESQSSWYQDFDRFAICADLHEAAAQIRHLFLKNLYFSNPAELENIVAKFFEHESAGAEYISSSFKHVAEIVFDPKLNTTEKSNRLIAVSEDLDERLANFRQLTAKGIRSL